jgi:thiosulfate reductase cytochrome b subunit
MKNKVYFYSLYERLWHWFQALAITILLVTGFEISYPSIFSLLGYQTAITVHNIVGLVLLLNAFLAFFYNVASGLIHRYFPALDDIFVNGLKHVSYYLSGIFKGQPHPFDKTPEKRLMPLQKITYFIILNILLPVMIFTGLVKYSAEFFPALVDTFGGLVILGPIHRFGAWLLGAFLLLHLYMITIGHTPFSNLISMITGYDYPPQSPPEQEK